MRRSVCLLSAALLTGPPALAQDSGGISVSVGVRSWLATWTSFTYLPPDYDQVGPTAAGTRLILLPAFAARMGDFTLLLSGMPSTTFDFANSTGSRQEFDVALGWTVVPGITVTGGYKRVLQREGAVRYEPKGPVIGLNGNATVNGPLSLYGQVALGKLRTSGVAGPNNVSFDARYSVSEFGLAYTLVGGNWVRRWNLTAGYRIQQMVSREAAAGQDGSDSTSGFTLGVSATF